jgi:toxin-antitoxin system PIN domain toxin
VIALDTNVLVYAHRIDSPFNTRAADVVRELAEGVNAWALPWPCIAEFFAVVTNHRIFSDPTPSVTALAQVDAWLASPSSRVLSDVPRTWSTLSGLVSRSKVGGAGVYDAHIAAICVDHGVKELWTADRDFSRFPSLTVRNPLI